MRGLLMVEGKVADQNARWKRAGMGGSDKDTGDTHQIHKAIDKCFDPELERTPSVQLFVSLDPSGRIHLVDLVTHTVLCVGYRIRGSTARLAYGQEHTERKDIGRIDRQGVKEKF